MWRDRTNLSVLGSPSLAAPMNTLLTSYSYISYRSSLAHHPTPRRKSRAGAAPGPDAFSDAFAGSSYGDEDRRRLLLGGTFENDSDAVIEMDSLPPRWADFSEEVTDLLDAIATKRQKLEKLHQKHVLPGFDDDEDKKSEEEQIDKLTQDITKGFHECHRCIQRIERVVRDSKDSGSLSRAEEIMANNIQISLAARVQEASASFRKKQSTYLRKLRDLGSMASFYPAEQSSISQPVLPISQSLQESDADQVISQSVLQTASQQKLLHSNDSAIANREREIEDIAQGIIELSDLFRDLQTIVIDQGTLLDRIDYNVERMGEDVQKADKELIIASGYQRRTTKRKIILLLILLVTGLFVLLLLKPKKRES